MAMETAPLDVKEEAPVCMQQKERVDKEVEKEVDVNSRNSNKNVEEAGCHRCQSKPSEAMTMETVPFPPGQQLVHQENDRRRKVSFSHVQVRNYKTTIGDNPSCSYGPPLSLGWEYREDNDGHSEREGIPIDLWESSRPQPSTSKSQNHRRKTSLMVMNATQRCARLFQAGFTMEEMKQATETIKRERFQRGPHSFALLDPIHALQELWIFQLQPILFQRFNKNQDQVLQKQMKRELRKMELKVRAQHNRSQSQLSAQSVYSAGQYSLSIKLWSHHDEEDQLNNNNNHLNNGFQLESPENTDENYQIVIEGMEVLQPTQNESIHSKSSGRLCSTHDGHDCGDHFDVHSLSTLDGLNDTDSSSTKSYGINVDRKQQDRASEIILLSLRRPHMRAFHASWFSFFAAFFSWFSITPLLGEIKQTLNLSNSEIWISSFMGTLSTIIMRLVVGPLCDKFGARRCMAWILIVAAIPNALTGFIQSSTGLSTIRFFIGIAGSSFVACQYWTSDMFTREVAGTANALAAGWGNLGGGVANLFMGSALFPLVTMIFDAVIKYDDEELEEPEQQTTNKDATDLLPSEELAWRTIFVIPAIVAVVTAILILKYCDDSPLGSYSDRIKNERMTVTTAMESFCASFKNWNVWILTLQYACCFGVEVTMTNATALYFYDEFGQSTVQAAAISSIFGFMNLFARGLGGLGSDWMQSVSGLRGRLAWQILVLVVEGLMIIVFAHTESMAGSIVALIFLSITVQAAEGSTFGIVPYVDTRFTGSVVGLVGSGGSIGAALFSLFFIAYSYRPAFLFMGVSAACSAVFTLFMNTTRISQIQDTLHVSVAGEDGLDDHLNTPATSAQEADEKFEEEEEMVENDNEEGKEGRQLEGEEDRV